MRSMVPRSRMALERFRRHERWAAIEGASPVCARGERWTPDGAKRLVGQRVGQPGKADEKGQAVADPTRDDERHRPAEAVGGH
ncbi:DUF6192 family protein [Streptomyces canus]|uniref:DUF6192 family protein n=1 Tax=Streptomyces canus TaxID=58343 RepID=UPI0039A5EA6A